MDPVLTLIATLGAIYALECLIWVRRNAVLFVRPWRRLRARAPEGIFGNTRGAFVLAPPLPPLGELFVAEAWPISITPTGVHTWTMSGRDPGSRRVDAEAFARFDEIGSISTDGRVLLIDGARFATLSSNALARRLGKLLSTLIEQAEAKRARSIEAALADALDVEEVRRRRAAFERRAIALRASTNLLFVYLAALVPAVFWWPWLTGLRLWLFLGLGVLLLGTTHALFYRAHRSLSPDAVSERRFRLLAMLLSPPDTVRALTHLSRELLADRHPLAVALAEGDAEPMARQLLRDLAHPAPLASPHAAPLEWFRAASLRAVENALRRHDLDPATLAAPPPRDEALVSYCPRCHQQYTLAEGACDDCAGVALVPY